jgi:hypothetical protein
MNIMATAMTRRRATSLFLLISIFVPGLPGGHATGDPYPAEPQSLILKYDATYIGYKFAEIDFSESVPYEFHGDIVRNLECNVESSGILIIDGRYRSVVGNDYTVLYFKSDEGSSENRKIAEYWFDPNRGKGR